LASRRALGHAEKLNHPIGVDELATAAGVSRPTLELGFRESFDISPQRFLRRAKPGQASVTEAAMHWGFVELGRTGVEYRQLFGEYPSTTLARDGRIDCRRYADALAFSASGNGDDPQY
jgi:AraC-like DNA-binding protein